MRLNDIEMSIAVGRTGTGKTITVRDLLTILATVSGARLGSQQFDQILADPQMIHAPDTICNARRYGLLEAILSEAICPPGSISLTSSTPCAGEDRALNIHIVSNTEDLAGEMGAIIDGLLMPHESRSATYD